MSWFDKLRRSIAHHRFTEGLKNFGTSEYFAGLEKRKKSENERMKIAIQKSLALPGIKKLIEKHGVSSEDLEALYQRLEIDGFSSKTKQMAVCNEDLVEYFVKNSQPSRAFGKKVRKIDLEVSITLGFWVTKNPKGKRPSS